MYLVRHACEARDTLIIRSASMNEVPRFQPSIASSYFPSSSRDNQLKPPQVSLHHPGLNPQGVWSSSVARSSQSQCIHLLPDLQDVWFVKLNPSGITSVKVLPVLFRELDTPRDYTALVAGLVMRPFGKSESSLLLVEKSPGRPFYYPFYFPLASMHSRQYL